MSYPLLLQLCLHRRPRLWAMWNHLRGFNYRKLFPCCTLNGILLAWCLLRSSSNSAYRSKTVTTIDLLALLIQSRVSRHQCKIAQKNRSWTCIWSMRYSSPGLVSSALFLQLHLRSVSIQGAMWMCSLQPLFGSVDSTQSLSPGVPDSTPKQVMRYSKQVSPGLVSAALLFQACLHVASRLWAMWTTKVCEQLFCSTRCSLKIVKNVVSHEKPTGLLLYSKQPPPIFCALPPVLPRGAPRLWKIRCIVFIASTT